MWPTKSKILLSSVLQKDIANFQPEDRAQIIKDVMDHDKKLWILLRGDWHDQIHIVKSIVYVCIYVCAHTGLETSYPWDLSGLKSVTLLLYQKLSLEECVEGGWIAALYQTQSSALSS